LVGYVYGVRQVYGPAPFTSLAVHAAMAFALLSLGLIFARPARGVMKVLASDTDGGVLARRLFPAVIVVPIAIGWLRLVGQRMGLYNLEFGITLFAFAQVVCLAAVTWGI